jgi:hypothetical protein
MDRVRWIEIKGRRILYADFTNLNTSKPEQKEIAFQICNELRIVIEKAPGKILFLTDITNASASSDVMQKMKEVVSLVHKLNKAEKECMVGAEGLKQSLLSSINILSKTKIMPFKTVEEAQKWLIE